MKRKHAIVHVYSDGGSRSNPGNAAIGVLVCDEANQELVRYLDPIGVASNNVAEYCALIAALEIAQAYHAQEVRCFLDSELVVRQLTGVYKVKHDDMRVLFHEVTKLRQFFSQISFSHLPRTHEKMRIADALVNEALDRVNG